MTVDQSTGNLPANPGDYSNTGLEDFDLTDAIIPRLQIVHTDGVFKDNLSGQRFDKLRLIILGLTKQRILWHQSVDDGDMPMCKSPDFSTGYPNLEAPAKKSFPWDRAGFDPNQFQITPTGQKPLPCSGCSLKEWGSHPSLDTPYCAEQWTLSVNYDPNNDGNWVPAFLTLQKSNIKPIRSYLTSFARTNRPAFTAVCEVSLSVRSRGSVDYSVASFTQAGESDRSMWSKWAEDFASMRSYLLTPPTSQSDDTDGAQPAASNNVNTPPPASAQQAPSPQQPPVQQQAPAPQQPPAPPQPQAQAPAPQAQAPAPQAQAPAPQAPVAQDDDDDLPF